MKRCTRLYLLACVLLTIHVSATAQVRTVNYGFKLGMNIASMTGDNIGNISSKPGFAIGFFLERQVSPSISIQPEILYSVKGAKETYSDMFFSDTYTMSISYLEIPVQVKYNFPLRESPITPHVFAGPSINVKTGATVTYESEYGSSSSDLENVNALDFGVQLGGGIVYNAPFGPHSAVKALHFVIHYERGLTNVKDTDYNWDAKNSTIALRVGAAI
jgi:hypothetical protein